jgi:malonyl-CoA/methylmalonyl-CoA synthetase
LPEKTEQDFIHDGFFDTGDKGCFDDEGYLSIVGRAKDMVITGGLNVYPKEVELVIDELEGIVESAVIGVPHLDFGEAVVAVVVLKPGFVFDESELISQIKDTLSSFKVPKRILVREELPRNTMGKVQKAVLRSECESLFR